MSRVQLSINVSDFDAAVAFYSQMFGTAPAKLRPGSNFAIDDPPLKLVLNSPGNGPGGTINHLGVEVGAVGDVTHAEARLTAQGLAVEPEPGAVCCYARQDKVWAHDPDGVARVSGSRAGLARQRPRLPAGIVRRCVERMFLPPSSAVTVRMSPRLARGFRRGYLG